MVQKCGSAHPVLSNFSVFSQPNSPLTLLQALHFVRRLLQYAPPDQPQEYLSLARLVIQVAYAAVAFSEQAVCAALDALSAMQSPGALRPCCNIGLHTAEADAPSIRCGTRTA